MDSDAGLAQRTDKATCADTYSELAFQTAIRCSMWATRPDRTLVAGWIEQALELSEAETVARAKALIAHSFWERNTPAAAREASELAERAGNIDFRSFAWGAQAGVAFGARDFEAALEYSHRRLDVRDQISDPDHVADIYEVAIPSCCANGRFSEARRLATEHDAVVEPLSDHHRLHGIALRLEVEEVSGGWSRILELAERTEAAVEANLSTPCVRNARSLLITALAAAYSGDDETAGRYERLPDKVATEGYDVVLAAPRTWLALVRAARLDALAALKERAVVERDAPSLLQSGTYLEPFALRGARRCPRRRGTDRAGR